jgi:hypothetical protein
MDRESTLNEIDSGLSEVIGRLLVPAMKDKNVKDAMERLSDIAHKFGKLAEQLENESFSNSSSEKTGEEQEFVKIFITEEMNKKMDKCAEGECSAEDCIDCCCQVCVLQV